MPNLGERQPKSNVPTLFSFSVTTTLVTRWLDQAITSTDCVNGSVHEPVTVCAYITANCWTRA
ncbi:MAG: hypothetical protein AAGA30_20305, partial [Planctomycetota bacterium]